MWDKLKQVPQQTASLIHLLVTEGEFLNFWILFVVIVEGGTVSPTSFSAAFCLFCNLFHVVWADVPCFLVVDEAAELKFWTPFENNSQTSWWQNHHFHHSSQRGGQTSIPHAYRQILFLSCCSNLLGYDSVCESSSPQQPKQQQQNPDQSPSSSNTCVL